MTLLVMIVAAFLVDWSSVGALTQALGFDAADFGQRPWSLLTYGFATGGSFFGTVITCFMLWWFGGSVERELGTWNFLIFFLAMVVLPVLFFLAGSAFMAHSVPVFGMYLPLAGVVIAWATRNPTFKILIMFCLPLDAKWIGWLTAGFVFFGYGFGAPALGVLAVLHLILAHFYAANKLPFVPWGKSIGHHKPTGWKPQERDDKYFENVRDREKERQDRDRLRKLLEGSVKDDVDD